MDGSRHISDDRPAQPLRHFMSLNPIQKLSATSNGGKLDLRDFGLSGSFIAPKPNKETLKLPDIYTTCGDLFHFRISNPMINTITEAQGSTPEETLSQIPRQTIGAFDPNEPIIQPHLLGFVPFNEWQPQTYSLWDLRLMYFTRRNGTGRRFDFKLYNALCITKAFPAAYSCVGAIWIAPSIMKIHSHTFAYLLGINAIQGGLFHKQGNFSRHGFQQILKQNVIGSVSNADCADVDDYSIRLYTDGQNRYSRETKWMVADAQERVQF